MKDFKTLPKMKCGGGVKKYASGGDISTDDVVSAIRSGKLVDRMPTPKRSGKISPAMAKVLGASPDAEIVDRMPMPEPSDTINIPGVGRGQRAPAKTTPSGAVLLKKGGKVKRGNKK